MTGGKLAVLLLSGFLMAGLAASVQAQDQGGGGAPAAGGGGGGGGGFGGGNGGNFRQQMMDRIKEALGATDEEWQAMLPKVEKVMSAQREMRGASMRMIFGGRGGRRGGDGAGAGGASGGADQMAESAVGKATQDLKQTLDDKTASADTIAQKLAALRDAQTKAKADLAAAQKDLRDLLTQRQEATLVMYGLLD